MWRAFGAAKLVGRIVDEIGRATALRPAASGIPVALAARRQDELDAVVSQIGQAGGSALAVPTDVARPDDIGGLVERALA